MRYRALYEREPDGSAWNVSFPDAPGCFTWGRTLAQAKQRAREALACHLDVKESDVDVEDVPVVAAADLVEAALRARRRASEANQEAQETTARAARALVDSGLSRRDAATVLGLSHQRVDQLVS